MTSENIGRYKIVRELGRGGMSTVYLAHDPNVNRQVALKLLPREFLHHGTFRERFNREARIIAALEHPAIVPIYDFGEEEGQPFFVMRFMQGGSLSDLLKRGPMPVQSVIEVLDRIGSALDHAHQNGIIHRDLKPANILYDQFGKAYLGDFGIARLQETGATLTGTVYLGTPAYMSPEQVQSNIELDGRADIYALGVILFEVLTGRKPYKAETAAGLALKHVTEPVPNVLAAKPDLPPDVQRVISKAMAKKPDDRYPTAVELTTDITGVIYGQGLGAPLATAGAAGRTPEPTAMTPGAAAAFAATAAGVAGTTSGTGPGTGSVAVPGGTPPGGIPAAAPPAGPRRFPAWTIPLAGLLILLCITAVVLGVVFADGNGIFGLGSGGDDTPTATATALPKATSLPTSTRTPFPTATASPTPTASRTPTATPISGLEPTLRPTFTPRASFTPAQPRITFTPTRPAIIQPTSPPTSPPVIQPTNPPPQPTKPPTKPTEPPPPAPTEPPPPPQPTEPPPPPG